MKRHNVTAIVIPNSDNKQVLLRDTGRALKVKTGLKAGVQKVREA